MKEKIMGLIQLQDCDNRIKEIIKRKNEGPPKIKKLETELNTAERRSQEENERLELLKKDRRHIEKDLQVIETKIEKSNIKLASIKSNKEYRAVLKEIEDLNHSKVMIEEKVLQIMEEIEDIEGKLLQNRDKIAEMKKEFELDRDKILKDLEGLDRKLQSFERERGNICETMEEELLNRYMFLKERKGGQAIGSVVSGVCQLCHTGIPPQQFNELRKGEALLTCPNCNRMIYWGEDEHYERVLNRIMLE